MNGVELTKAVARDTGIPEDDVKEVIRSLHGIIIRAVSEGDSVSIRNFGTFSPLVRRSKIAQDLKRKVPVVVPERTIPKFRPAAVFTRKVQLVGMINKKINDD